eukprot:168815-Chlamydomonas_euryale.AAC.1
MRGNRGSLGDAHKRAAVASSATARRAMLGESSREVWAARAGGHLKCSSVRGGFADPRTLNDGVSELPTRNLTRPHEPTARWHAREAVAAAAAARRC